MDDLDHDSNRSRTYSTRQRIVVVTFRDHVAARLWDDLPPERAIAWLNDRDICIVERPEEQP